MSEVQSKNGSMGRLIIIALVLLALIFAAVMFWPTRGSTSDLLDHLIAARDSLAIQDETVEAAAARLATPEAALAFVRDDVRLASYAGRYLDPEAALNLRQANAADKTVLLGHLVEAQGFEVRYRAASAYGSLHYGGDAHLQTPEMLALLDFLGVDDLSGSAGLDRDARDVLDVVSGEIAAFDAMAERLELDLPLAGIANYRDTPRYHLEYRDAGGEWVLLDAIGADAGWGIQFPRDWTPGPVQQVGIALETVDDQGVARALLDWQGSPALALNIGFQPTHDLMEFYQADMQTGATPLAWLPVLQAGESAISGRAFSLNGRALPDAPATADGLIQQTAPPLSRFEITHVDASRWPNVRARIAADAPDGHLWSAGQIRIEDNGSVRRARIEAQAAGGRPIILLIDISLSMDTIIEGSEDGTDRLGLTREIATDLVRALGDNRRVGIVTFAGSASLQADPRTPRTADALAATLATITDTQSNTNVADAVRFAAASIDEPADFILFSDGALASREPAVINEAIQDNGGNLHVVAVALDPSSYDPLNAVVRRMDSGRDVGPLTDMLASEVGGTLTLSFDAADEAAPGDVRNLEIRATGQDLGDTATYTVTDNTDHQPASLRLTVSVETADGIRSRSARLVDLDAPDLRFALMSRHRVSVSLGESGDTHIVRRNLDRLIDIVRLDLAQAEGQIPDGRISPWADYDSLAQANNLRNLARAAFVEHSPNSGLSAPYPMVVLDSRRPFDDGEGNLGIESQINIIDDGGWQSYGSRAASPAHSGIALAGAEAAILGMTGIADSLAGDSETRAIRDGDDIPDWVSAEAYSLLSYRGSILLSPNLPDRVIAIDRWGNARSHLLDPIAKGGRARAIAGSFTDGINTINAASHVIRSMGGGAGVPGIPMGMISAIIETNMRYWCYSTVMLGYVSAEIATGEEDVGAWQSEASDACGVDINGMSQAYAAGMAGGFARGWANSVIGAGVKGYVFSGPGWGTVDSAAATGVTTTGTSALNGAISNAVAGHMRD